MDQSINALPDGLWLALFVESQCWGGAETVETKQVGSGWMFMVQSGGGK